MNLTNASSFRRTMCGLFLIVGPLMILVASILDPASGEGDDTGDYLAAIKDDPDMAELSTALWMYGFALTAIGIIGLVHVIRTRGVVLANIGGGLAILGMIMFQALFASTINDLTHVENLPLATAENLSDSLEEDYWVPYAVLIPALVGFLFGFILLGAAVIRSKVAHIAAGIMIIVGTLLVFFGDTNEVVNVIGNVILLAGFGLVGLKLLGLTDEQWEGRAPIGAADEPALAGGPPAGGAGPTPPAAPPPNV